MAEWLIAPVLKTGEGASLPGVRIPLYPPFHFIAAGVTPPDEPAAPSRLWNQHDRAGSLATFEGPVRVCGIGQGEASAGFHLDGAAADRGEERFGASEQVLTRCEIMRPGRT